MDHQSGALALPEMMLLVHPMWLPSDVSSLLAQGPSSFPGLGPAADPCMSSLLWGYECPFETPAIHGDHVWPYWAGGPTVGTNRLSLCAKHNGMKAGDVHLFPWESPPPSWLHEQITRIQDLRRSAIDVPP